MRIAALSDIHGNLPALEAVLADIERESVDGIVVAGDTISGPWAAECFDLVTAAGALVVRGNADRLVLGGGEGGLGTWSAERLGERLSRAAEWPLTVELDVDGLGRVLVCHSTPTDDEVIYTRVTPDEDVVARFGDVTAEVVVVGHTHIQSDRTLSNGLRVVNPGSVGLPYEGRRGAFWAVLGQDFEFRRSEYDVDGTLAAIREEGVPVEAQLLRLLEDPPTSDEATAHHERLRGA
ncbi:MAG: YfcE family phosphodiesterase [Gaiellaceae bacterium]